MAGTFDNILPFDPTPGFNIRNPFNKNNNSDSWVATSGGGSSFVGPTYRDPNAGVGGAIGRGLAGAVGIGSQPLDASTSGQTLASDIYRGGGDVDYTGQARSALTSQMERIASQLGIARSNINDQYGVRQNELNSGFGAAENAFNSQSTQNRQGLVTDRNNINEQSSQGLRGLLRMLGAMGAGGSSDRLLAGDAVTNQANLQLSGAGQNYAGNQQALDTNWGGYKSQDEAERKRLNDWKTQQLNSAEQQSQSNRQDILYKLANLGGGNAQQYLQDANGLGSQIDQLSRFSPTYTGNTPVFNAPNLSSYDTGQSQVGINSGALQGSGSTPFLNLLVNQDDRRRRF